MQRPPVRIAFWLGLVVLAAAGGFTAYWSAAPPERTCRACHELHGPYDAWAQSAHRDVRCEGCHGGTFSNGLHGLAENARRVVRHFETPFHEEMGLSEEQVVAMTARCRTCHAQEYAGWLASGHSLAYADVFLNAAQNRIEPPNNDCFRCHGLFYEGSVEGLLAPPPFTNDTLVWAFADVDQAARPAIPCLACHALHTPGVPATRPAYADPATIAAARAAHPPAAGLYDRREGLFFAAAALPTPRLTAAGRPVAVAADPVQRVCVQCHAPNAAHEAGTGDDRTPRGVHEGLACASCHQGHRQDTRASCAACHPALSNCGLDVATMNTSFASPGSPNDLHTVACADCHAGGPPRR